MCCFTKFCMTAWKIYSPKNISLKNNSKNDFPKKKLCPSDCVNGKYYLLE